MIGGIGSGAPLYGAQELKRDAKEVERAKGVEETNKTKVETIKEQVQNGEYKLDVKKTAESMVLNLLA